MKKNLLLVLGLFLTFSGFGQGLWIVNNSSSPVSISCTWTFTRLPFGDYFINTGGNNYSIPANGSIEPVGPFTSYNYECTLSTVFNGNTSNWTGDVGPDFGDSYVYVGTLSYTTNITLTCTNNQAGYVNVAQFEKNGVYIDSQDLAPYAGCSRTYQVQVSGGVISPNYTVQLLPGWPVSTNTIVTLHNPANSGVVDSATWTFDGMPFDFQQNIMPGQTVSRSHICSTFDPVDTFTGSLAEQQGCATNVSGSVLNNTIDKIVNAYWNLNGSVVKTEYLSPGQSDTMSETLDICDSTPESFTWGYTITGDFSTNNTGMSTNAQGSTTTTNSSSGAGTITQTGGNGSPFTIYTNNILYPDGSNSVPGAYALDSTLKTVGGNLHNDNLNTLSGMSVLHNDIQNVSSNLSAFNLTTQFGTLTNQAGQIIQYEAIMTNDMMQIVRAITNSATNMPPNTNVWVENWPSNIVQTNNATSSGQSVESNLLAQIQASLTNFTPSVSNAFSNLSLGTNSVQLGLTNYATESTLQGISNLLGNTNVGSDTNDYSSPDLSNTTFFDTNFSDSMISNWTDSFQFTNTGETSLASAMADSVEPNMTIVESGLLSMRDAIQDFSAGMSDEYPSVPMVVNMADMGLPGGVMDLDPLHDSRFADLFALAKQLFTWAIALMFLIKITDDAFKLVFILNSAHGINASAVKVQLKNK